MYIYKHVQNNVLYSYLFFDFVSYKDYVNHSISDQGISVTFIVVQYSIVKIYHYIHLTYCVWKLTLPKFCVMKFLQWLTLSNYLLSLMLYFMGKFLELDRWIKK